MRSRLKMAYIERSVLRGKCDSNKQQRTRNECYRKREEEKE